MGLKKDYPSEDPASTPTGEQDPAVEPVPPSKWIPTGDGPLGPEGSHFFECALGIWDPGRSDLPGVIFWSCKAPTGHQFTGQEASRVEARIAAEESAAKWNADQIGKQLQAADKFSRDHKLCVHCRSDLDADDQCTGCGMGQAVDGSHRIDPSLCANCEEDTQKIGTSAAGGAGIRWCPECGTIECLGVFQVPAQAQL